jgi:hypothetical protein
MADYLPPEVHLDSIEWAHPANVAHWAVVFTGGASGVTVFHEQCTTANQSVIKYFHGLPIKPPYIPAAATNKFGSGALIIVMAK